MSAHGGWGGLSHAPRPGPLDRLGGLAFRQRGRVLIGWDVALGIAVGLSAIRSSSRMPGLVPAVMHLLGRSNWWLPRSMARRLPQLHIEGPPTMSAWPLEDAEAVPAQ